MTKHDIMNDVEMEVEDSSETKETEKMNDVDVDVDGMEDETMNDIIGMEVEDTETKEDVMNVDLLLDLLDASKKAGEEIADKHVLLQIGLTGAGKTTSTLYLAGAKFEEEDVDGYSHYKPTEIPNEALSEFAVSGGAKSVTTIIQACTFTFKQDDGKDDIITICDTPGFGDTKGKEMDISNGLGIIHALKCAASIKPVIVIDHRTMDGSRFSPLRKNLSTVIAMIGRESIDFSPFAYIFTRCEGKNKNRISKQLSGFQKVVRDDLDIEDKDILDLLLTDMICKTKPGEAICIDPEEHDDAPDTLKRLLSGSRLNDPANSFVNFCSKESMATLSVQVNILVHNLDISLQAAKLDSAEAYLRKMIGLAKALSLPEVDQDVEKGIIKAKRFVSQLTSSIESLATRIFSEFDATLDALSSDLILLSKSASICNICEMDFNCCSFINGIIERLFSAVRQHISDVDPTALQGAKSLQQSIFRFDSLATSLQGRLMKSEAIQSESSTMIEAIKNIMEPIFVTLEDSLVASDPTAATLNENIDKVNFVLAMNNFLGSSELSTLNQKLSDWVMFQSGLNNILSNINDKSQICVTDLADLDKALHEELLGAKEWSYASLLKLNNSMEHKECRDFLQAVSSSESLFSAIENDSTPDFELMIREFGDYIIKYSQIAVDFLQRNSQTVLDNKTVDTAGRVKEASRIAEYVDLFLGSANTLKELDPVPFQKVWENLTGTKGRLEQFIGDSKKNLIRQKSRRGKTIEPSEEEISQTKNKRGLLGWYKKCNELKVYLKKHGHCNVPRKDPKHKQLGRWVMTQRTEMRKFEAGAGLKTAMTDEKEKHLEDMGFQWSVKKEHEDAMWNQRYEELKKFKDEHGHCHVPRKSSGKLGIWVKNMKSTSRRPKCNEKIEKLEAIGFFES